ncbi:hypothetical protein KEM54_006449 [Ascosphaera aggregata]|nr:hypothetical protein KEM54_006449 [Ascosphaera aggregata]
MAAKSRWAVPSPEEEALAERKRLGKEAKKRAKEARLRQQQVKEVEAQRHAAKEKQEVLEAKRQRMGEGDDNDYDDAGQASTKRVKVLEATSKTDDTGVTTLLRFPVIDWTPCRHVDNFESLNRIEEGSYGFVTRAKDKNSGAIVALKKLKMDDSGDGFPVTGLREIQTLFESRHENILNLQEIAVGNSLDDVYLVMDFIEHDLKILLEDMQEPFLPSEVKTILRQIIAGTDYLHSHWIMHRDLKTSNILLNNRGEVKLADFGMARYFGDPPPQLTKLVVTLWYRAPELLLGEGRYGPEIDMWSIGCIFAELLLKEPLLQARNEAEQLRRIFDLTGFPTSEIWPDFPSLPGAKVIHLPTQSESLPTVRGARAVVPVLPRDKFPPHLSQTGLLLLSQLLALNPSSRLTADEALSDPWFFEDPKPKAKEMFPSFPSKAGLEKRRRKATPEAPRHGARTPQPDFNSVFNGSG